MLNKAPLIHPISNIVLPNVEQTSLDNGMPLAIIDFGDQEICFLSLAFHAGRTFEKQKMIARATAYMLKEGAGSRSSAEISETLDFHGAHLSIHSGMDYLKINLYCLTKHLDKIIPLLGDILTQPTFPETELIRFKQRSIEKLKEQLKRTEIVSYRELTSLLYGHEHPYGYNSSVNMINDINVESIKSHFNSSISAHNGVAVVAGKISKQTLKVISDCLNLIPKIKIDHVFDWTISQTQNGTFKHKIEGALQTSIRIGTKLFNKEHEDYDKMYIVNMILGGYFGSRLSQKIREELGLVYGIYSHTDTLKNDGIFYITTETSHENIERAEAAIFDEMEYISNNVISNLELERAKNYLLGRVLYMVNGTFELTQTVVQSLIEGKDPTHIIKRIENLKLVDQNQVLEISKKYFSHANWTKVLVGL